jgi:hypothetical protein
LNAFQLKDSLARVIEKVNCTPYTLSISLGDYGIHHELGTAVAGRIDCYAINNVHNRSLLSGITMVSQAFEQNVDASIQSLWVEVQERM